MDNDQRAFEIISDEEKCAGCLMCQMRCAYRMAKAFNPSASAVEILRRPEGKREFRIVFQENCDQCGLCALHCTYGALGRRRRQ